MHDEVISPGQLQVLPLLSAFSRSFYLAGDTGIALYIGHRRSLDFDLFSKKEINSLAIRNSFIKNGRRIQRVLFESSDQFDVMINGVKLTFIQFPFAVDTPEKFGKHIKLPDLLTLAAMKAFALGRRAKWKDNVDLYYIFRHYADFDDVIMKAQQIFGNNFNDKLFRQQLAWHQDIDYSEAVDYLAPAPTDQEIKDYLTDISTRPF